MTQKNLFPFVTPAQAAGIAGVCLKTLRRWIDPGLEGGDVKLPAFWVGSRLYVRRSDIVPFRDRSQDFRGITLAPPIVLLGLKEAAAMAGVGATAILRWVDEGLDGGSVRLQGHRQGRQVLIREDDLRAFLAFADRYHRPATDDDKQNFVLMYESGMSGAEIARQTGFAETVVQNCLKKMNVALRHHGDVIRKYHLNEAFFRNMDTQEAAWLHGFISADGHVSEQGFIAIALARRDRCILERIRELLAADHPIYDHGPDDIWPHPQSVIKICSPRLVADLRRQGLYGRKVDRLTPWQGPPHLMRHWWRGMLDGDGAIMVREISAAYTQCKIHLVGTKPIIDAFADWIGASLSVQRPTVSLTSNRSRFETSVSCLDTCKRLVDLLYDGATVCMPRKKAVADLIAAMSYTVSRGCFDGLTREEVLRLHADLGSWDAVAEKLGVNVNAFHCWRTTMGGMLVSRDWSWLTADLLSRLRREHGSWAAVARYLGMGSNYLNTLLRRAGL